MSLASFLRSFGKKKVVTRIAPSPTGNLHVGTARAALFNYLYAKKHGGRFICRLEDTDRARSTKAFEENIVEGLRWLGIAHDAFYRQSERTPLYREHLARLIEEGKAYVSHEAAKDDAAMEVDVVRLKNPGKEIVFTDLIRGEIRFDTKELGDFVIARSISDPLYHFAVVVDDFDMDITHVIRGEDHISNTPRQILIQEALGFPRPQYAHIPLILAPDRSKLSKRHGATAVNDYRRMGVLPEAMDNYLAFLGWNPGGDREVFSLAELADLFRLEQVQKGGAVFDIEKLKWYNREYMKRMPPEDLVALAETYLPEELIQATSYQRERFAKALPVLLERLSLLSELTQAAAEGELAYYFDAPTYPAAMLEGKGKATPEEIGKRLAAVTDMLTAISSNAFTKEVVKEALWPYAETEGRAQVLWPLRVALSGKEKSPDPFTLAEVLGKDETLKRIETALTKVR